MDKQLDKKIKRITKNKNLIYTKQFLTYETKNVYGLEHINNMLKIKLELDKRIKVDKCILKRSQRYMLFTRDEQVCVKCGLKASFWALQRSKKQNTEKYHLNLYGIDNLGRVKLFTKDHIMPKSKGGADILSNYQIMCSKCNAEKSDKI